MWFFTVLSIIGVILNIHKSRVGFAVWIVTNSCWAYVDFTHGLPAQGWLFVIYVGLAVWGFVNWGSKDTDIYIKGERR